MIFSTTPDVPRREINENLGVVAGNIVQSKHVGRDLIAGLKGIVGGEIAGYTEMLADAIVICLLRRHQQKTNLVLKEREVECCGSKFDEKKLTQMWKI